MGRESELTDSTRRGIELHDARRAAREARIERIRARQRRLLTLAPWFCGAVPTLAIVWSVHVWSTLHRDPFGLGFDFALFAASSLLRVVAFLVLGLLLVRVHAVLFRNPRRAIVAAATWGALGTLVPPAGSS